MAALTRNRCAVEKPAKASSAARAGPTTRDPLIITELRLTAPARSARSTSKGTLACIAGAFIALPIPIANAAANNVQIGWSVATRIASTTLNAICTSCMAMR